MSIVEEARRWLGVKFHHQGRTREAGVDCLGLLVKVAENCGLQKDGVALHLFDRNDYGRNPDAVHLRASLSDVLREIDVKKIAPGDVGIFMIERRPQHLAIISDYPVEGELGMIHSYAPARKVVEHRMDAAWRAQLVAAFRF